MTEPTAESGSKGWLVDALETSAERQRQLSDITLRMTAAEARHKRVRDSMSTALAAVFTLAFLFGLVMGALAMWNAVVG